MTLLPWVEINNFRGISHLRYEPKQVNLLIGRNNSGKSTILEAIYAVLTGRGTPVFMNNERSLNRYAINVHAQNASVSSKDHQIYLYRNLDEIPEEYQSNLSEILNKILSFEGKFTIDEFLKKEILNYFINAGRASFVVYDRELRAIYLDFPYRGSLEETANDLMKILSKSTFPQDDIREYVFFLSHLSFINDKADDSSKNIELINNRDKFYFPVTEDPLELIELDKFILEHNLLPNVERLMEDGLVYRNGDETYFLPYSAHGTGLAVLLNLISSIRQCRDGVLLIEEPENHMHPGYLQVFVENLMMLAKKLNVQVFMTTHSYDLIEALSRYPMDAAEEDSILISNVVSRDGKHELYNYSPSDAQKTMNQLMIDLRGT